MRFGRYRARTVALLGALALLATGCGGSDGGGSGGSGGEQVDEVVIGAPLPLTGPGGAFGVPYLAALQLTVDAINADGGIKSLGGAKLRLESVDDASDAARDAQLIQQLAAKDVSAFVGPLLSASVISSIPVITRAERPFVGPNLDNAVTDANSPWIFRVAGRATTWGDQAFDWLDGTLTEKSATVRKVGIVGIDVPPGTSTTDVIQARAEENGWEVVRIDYDQRTTLDFAPIVSRLRDANVDIVMGYQNPNDAVLFAKAVSQQSWKPAQGFLWIAGGQYLTSFKEAVGPIADNWVVESYAPELARSKSAEIKELATQFQAKTGQPLRGLAGAAPAVVTVLAAAIEKAASADPAKIRDALKELRFASPDEAPFPYYSMAGGVEFDDKGDNTAWKGIIVQWTGDQQTSVSPQEVSDGQLVWPATT
ncbi:MAG TPA: ABC transporter substrate-binding protein [Pseudonocardiaceae bacterium]